MDNSSPLVTETQSSPDERSGLVTQISSPAKPKSNSIPSTPDEAEGKPSSLSSLRQNYSNSSPTKVSPDLESPIDSEFRSSLGSPEGVGSASTPDLGGIDADNESSPESSPSLCLNATRNPSLCLATIQEFPTSSSSSSVSNNNNNSTVHVVKDSPLTTPTMENDTNDLVSSNSDDSSSIKQKYGTFYDETASADGSSGGGGSSSGRGVKKDGVLLDNGGNDADQSETGSLASSLRDSEHSGGASGGGYQANWSRDTAGLVQSPSFTGTSQPPTLMDDKPSILPERRSWRLLDGFKPSEIFRKLTVRDAREEAPTEMQEYNSSNSSETSPITSSVRPHPHHHLPGGIQRADKLPQSFVVRFLGKRPCNGLWGIRNTRRPTDELVMGAKNANGGQDAPALVITVSEDGVYAENHVSNINRDFTPGLLPIQNISYGVQDVRFTRVVAFVVVTEDIAANKTHCDCYVYLCDSKLTARKIAYALARAFKEYGKKIQAAGGGAAALTVDLNDLNVTSGTGGMTPTMVPLEEADESKCDGGGDDGVEENNNDSATGGGSRGGASLVKTNSSKESAALQRDSEA